MPEGHSVFINARDHQKMLAGKKLAVTSPQGRFASDAKKIDGLKLKHVVSLGKHLFYEFSKDKTLHIHLGRLGRFREKVLKAGEKPPVPTPATRVRLLAANAVIDLSGPTVCEVLGEDAVKVIRERLGPDLLDPRADRETVWKTFQRRSTPIGAIMMDQSILCGIGNIFRAEILYLCQIHPATAANELSRKQFLQIWKESVRQLQIGVKLGRIVTVPMKGLKQPVEKLKRDERFFVYKRKTCGGCGAIVKTISLAGRPCYFCPDEQRT